MRENGKKRRKTAKEVHFLVEKAGTSNPWWRQEEVKWNHQFRREAS